MSRALLVLLSVSWVGCGEAPVGDGDLAMPVMDLASPSDDLAIVPQDLAAPAADLAAPAEDLAAPAADLLVVHDLSTPPDMALPACPPGSTVAPDELRCTGLYSDWNTRTIAASSRAYAPGFALWSDGAVKSRYLYLPPTTKIDVSDLNDWTFPIGTKLWKEFRVTIGGVPRKVETRFLWKISNTGAASTDWVHTSYAWSADETTATKLSAGMAVVPGTASATAIPGSSTTPYLGYEIPSEAKCAQCHGGRKDFVLSMEGVLMAAPEATGLTYAMLQVGNLLTSSNLNEDTPASSLQIPGSATERAALGRLHTNCGVCCHNPRIASASTDQRLRIEIDNATKATPASALLTPSVITTVNVAVDPSSVYPVGPQFYRLRPTDTTRSGIYFRDGQREIQAQMPPLCTHAASDEIEAATAAWLTYMTPAHGYPAPAP